MMTFPSIASTVKNYNCSASAFLPRIVTVPLVQEKRMRCKPVVFEGDIVNEGDVIAIPEANFHGAKLHSPVPGVVIGLFSTICPDGRPGVALKIKMQGRFSYTGRVVKPKDWNSIFSDSIKEKIAEKGVVNTYNVSNIKSLAFQIESVARTGKKHLIVRMFDEDPMRITDSIVTKLYLNEVRRGACITAKALGAVGILYVFPSEKELKEIAKEITTLGDREKIFIMEVNKNAIVFKNEICTSYRKSQKHENGFDISKNDLFVDSSTMYDVWQAVENDIPVMEKLVHFSGDCLFSSCLLSIKIGSLLRDVVEQLGGFKNEPDLIVINGHLTGYSVQSLDVPITKYVKSVSFLSKKKSPDQFMYSCISCGNCRAACSRKLSPDLLYLYKAEKKPVAREYVVSATLCVECGLCNSVCPSRIPLSQVIISIKHSIARANLEGKNV